MKADEEIDASGKIIFPGGIDPHVHLDMPFMGTFSSDNYETGTLAALHGGTTMVIDFILQNSGKSFASCIGTMAARSNGNCYGDYSFPHGSNRFQWEYKKLNNGEERRHHFIQNFYGLQRRTHDRRSSDGWTDAGSKKAGRNGNCTCHQRRHDRLPHRKTQSRRKTFSIYHYLSQPEITEAEASGRFADMANYTGVPAYIVHMTCEGALNHVRRCSKKKSAGFCRNLHSVSRIGCFFIWKRFWWSEICHGVPPLREKKKRSGSSLGRNQQGTVLVSYWSLPVQMGAKKMVKRFSKIPNGHPAIEHRMELLYSEGVHKGKKSHWINMFEVSSTNAAKLFGMYPKKGNYRNWLRCWPGYFRPSKKTYDLS